MPLVPFQRRRVIRFLAAAVLLIGIGVGGTSWWMFSRSQQVPEFYTRVIDQSDEGLEVSRNHMQRGVAKLQNDASRQGHWQASFDDEQINAWLSGLLPEKFARWLARGVRDPAIAIEDGRMMAAVRYTSPRINTVISCELTVSMTQEANLLAIQLSNLKAGALPLPLEPFVRRISHEAALGDLDVRWDFTDEGPIALVSIPEKDDQYVFSPVVIESVDLVAGRLSVAGRTGEAVTADYQPRGPVHQFVRYRSKRTPRSRQL